MSDVPTCRCDHAKTSYVEYTINKDVKNHLCRMCGLPLAIRMPTPLNGIAKTFAYHRPSDESGVKIRSLREGFSRLKEHVEAVSPVSRERSVALTELETAAMWAIKAVVANDPASTPEP